MSEFYELKDRVPRADIDSLTVEAIHERTKRTGAVFLDVRANRKLIIVGQPSPMSGIEKMHAVEAIARHCNLRAHAVIAEIRAIGERLERCVVYVHPSQDECSCFACLSQDKDECDCSTCVEWREDRVSCPTCYHRNRPRATDHRNGCSGSNEAGQEGSRYA